VEIRFFSSQSFLDRNGKHVVSSGNALQSSEEVILMLGLEEDGDDERRVANDLIFAFGSEARSFFFGEPFASTAVIEIEDHFCREDFVVLPLPMEVGGGSAHVEGHHLTCLHSLDYQVAHVLEHHLLLHFMVPDINHS